MLWVGSGARRGALTLDGVVLHADQEAGRELGAGGAGVEERGRGVGEPALRQQVVRLHGCGTGAVQERRNKWRI